MRDDVCHGILLAFNVCDGEHKTVELAVECQQAEQIRHL